MEAREEPDRRIIEKEVKAVLEQQAISASPAVPDKRLLAIFDAAQVNLAPILNQLEACIKGGYDTTAILSDLAARLLDKEAIQSVFGEEKVLTCGDITDLADFAERQQYNCRSDFISSDGSEASVGNRGYTMYLSDFSSAASRR